MTRSTVYPDVNHIIEHDPAQKFRDVTTCNFGAHTVTFNCDVYFVLPVANSSYVHGNRYEGLTYLKGAPPYALKTSIFDRPIQTVWIDTVIRDCSQVEWKHVELRDDGTGHLKPREKVKVTTHGQEGFSQVIRYTSEMNSADCCQLLEVVLQAETYQSYSIQLDHDHFSHCFNMLALGNYPLSGSLRIKKKLEWLSSVAHLNQSIACLKNVNDYVQTGLMNNTPVCQQIYVLQELFAQLVQQNFWESSRISIELSRNGDPSTNYRHSDNGWIQLYWADGGSCHAI